MIALSSAEAAMLYLCITMISLLSLWGYQHYQSRRKKIITTSQELFVCEYCHFAYLSDIAKDVTQCQQCLCYNKHNTYKRR